MFQVFQMFYLDVASVSCECCKNRSVCCNGCIRMLQAFVPNVSTVFPDVCCIYFTHMLQVFYLDVVYMVLKCFSGVFASVSDACFKCFICLQTYVASVASGCFKSRSVLHLAPSSVSPPSLGASWASEPEAQAGAAPSPSSQCLWRGGAQAAASGAGWRSFCSVVPLRERASAPSVTLFRGFVAEIGRLLWQILDGSQLRLDGS